MRLVVDARYLSDPFGSMTVYCRNLLRAVGELYPRTPPVALVPRELDPSAHAIRDELGEKIRWVRAEVERHRLGMIPSELRWVHRDIPSLIARWVPDADLLIMPYHHPPVRTPGVRRVVVLHDLCGLGAGFPKHKRAYWRHYLRLRAAAHLADAIVPISRATRDEMAARFPASRSRLSPVVYNGQDRDPVSPQDTIRVLAEHDLETRSYVVAFATWQERKNFGATLAALTEQRRRGGWAPRLVGIAPGDERDSIRRRCTAEGLDDAVILSGVPDGDLDALYAGSLALLWPSTCEGFGYPVLEAMMQGCPPLVGERGPGAELVHGAIAPLTSLAPRTIAARLDLLAAQGSGQRADLAEALRARAAQFSATAYRDQLHRVLQGIAVK